MLNQVLPSKYWSFVILIMTMVIWVGISPVTAEIKAADSTYEVLVSTPIGEVPGKVRVNVDGNNFSGVLTLFNHDNPFDKGTIKDGKIAFSGQLKTPIGEMNYDVTGTFIDGKIDAVAKTMIGNLVIKSK